MKNVNIWARALEYLLRNKEVILITIVKTEGSAPGKTGFKMMVFPSGQTIGTVGGGSTEFNMVEIAKQMLRDGDNTPVLKHFDHREDAEENRSGMICSGSNTIAVITLGSEHKKIVGRISANILDNRPFRLCITPDGLELKKNQGNRSSASFTESDDGKWSFEEDINTRETLYIVGGGHVSLALSRIAEALGFYIIVFDDRKELVSMQKNRFADELLVIDYNDIDSFIPDGENSYVVIMTFGHLSDKLVLERLLNKKLRYLGMMSSRSKRDQVFKEMIESGFEKTKLDRVYAPVGLPINSITPEEIAVSISAEIIKNKNS